MDNSIKDRIRVELEQIEQLFTIYANLLEGAATRTPDVTEIAAIGSILHSFYSGIENIFVRIAKDIDRQVPADANWHRALLKSMTASTQNRRAVLSQNLTARLAQYLSFRHFYRHAYTFFLDWTQLRGLVLDMKDVWHEFNLEMTLFLSDRSRIE